MTSSDPQKLRLQKNSALKALFPGHYRLSDQEFRQLWIDGVVVFDANVLLNLYRYSLATRNSFIRVIGKLKPRIWIPHQAALEFQSNRLSVIASQTESYSDAKRQAEQLLEKLKSPFKHPFVSDPMLEKANGVLGALIAELTKRQADHEKLLHSDPGLEELTDLFSDNVGAEPKPETMAKYVEVATSRLKAKIPPGFCDNDKDSGRDLGDCILWLETLDYAAEVKKPMIFVTDDAKEDWWLIVRGQTIGGRPELVKEFFDRTGHRFYMYQPNRFVEFAGQHLQERVDPDVIKEVREMADDRAFLERVRGEKLTRPVHSENELESLFEIAKHVGRHAEELNEFLRVVGMMPRSKWDALKHPMLVEPEVLSQLQRILGKCRCVAVIADQSRRLPSQTLAARADDLARFAPRECDLIFRLHQIPDGAMDLVRLLSNAERRESDRAKA